MTIGGRRFATTTGRRPRVAKGIRWVATSIRLSRHYDGSLESHFPAAARPVGTPYARQAGQESACPCGRLCIGTGALHDQGTRLVQSRESKRAAPATSDEHSSPFVAD